MTVDSTTPMHEEVSQGTLGEEMRAIRRAARATIEQAEFDLRIKAHYIEAIESGDVAALPSRVYADGFLRNYAAYLGLDPEEVVRRFYAEAGVVDPPKNKRRAPKSATRTVTVDPLAGITSLNRTDSGVGSLRRVMMAVLPIALVSSIGFGAYAGYKVLNGSGMIPIQLGGSEQSTGDVVNVAAAVDEVPLESREIAKTDEKSVPPTPVPAIAETATASLDDADEIVGEASPSESDRPETLSYARAGLSPYWQTEPPKVEPVDGPIAAIKPETAGLFPRTEQPARGRWSSSGGESNLDAALEAPTAADASRIAAEARKALAATLGMNLSPSNGADEPPVVDISESADPTGEPDFGAAQEPVARVSETYASITGDLGPATVIETAPTPTETVQTAASRFALHATDDTWVQVQDAFGNVRYTGILSPGESYNVPNIDGLQLQTGNAGGLYIEIDGQRFGPLGNTGAIMRNVPLNPGIIRASYRLARQAT